MKRTALLVPLVLVLMLFSVMSAAAARGEAPPSPPPVSPVEVNEVCQERLPDAGSGFGWYADGCNLAYQTIVFDGVTGHEFCWSFGDNVLTQPGPYGCGLFNPVFVVTGDNSVDACLDVNGRVVAPFAAGCLTPAVL